MKQSDTDANDQQLVQRVQRGDKRAFDLLVLKYQFKLQSIISRFVRDRDEIPDVTQEAFIKAYRALPGFRGESQFYTWLYRIAVNTAKNYLVSRSRRPPSADIEAGEAEQLASNERLHDLDSPENRLFCEQLDNAIRRTIADLPEDLRTTITLREFEDLSYADIATIMQCPTGTVRSRLFRAREIVDAKVRTLIKEN